MCRASLDELPCTAKLLHAVLLVADRPRNGTLFEQDRRFLSEIRHPNIVQYLGVALDEESGLPILLIELVNGRLRHSLSGAIGGAADVPRAGQHQPRHNARHCLLALESHRPPRPLEQQRVADRCRQQSKGDGFRDEHADRTESSHDQPNQVPGQSSVHISRSSA